MEMGELWAGIERDIDRTILMLEGSKERRIRTSMRHIQMFDGGR